MASAVMDSFDISDVHSRATVYATSAAKELHKMNAIANDDGEVRSSLVRAFTDGFFAGVEQTAERRRGRR